MKMEDIEGGTPATREFREWFEHELEGWTGICTKIVADGEHQPPMFFVYRNKTDATVVDIPSFDSLADKDKTTYMHRVLGHHKQVFACVFTVETWTLSAEPEDYDKLKNHNASIEDHPDRGEGIVFNAISHGMQLMAMLPINRKDNTLGKPTIIDLMDPTTRSEGRMV